MIAMDQLTADLATETPRPSKRTFELPGGTSAEERGALVDAVADGLREIRTWPSPGEVGDASHFVLDTQVAGKELYVQFLSEPSERGILCEVASGFYGGDSMVRATDAQRHAMVSRGFSDGRAGNFRKDLVFDAPDAARAIAEEALSLLGSVFGWTPAAAITATIRHTRRACSALVFDAISPDHMVELLARHGVEATLARNESVPTVVEAAFGGLPFTVHFLEKEQGSTSRHRTIVARARVGRGIDAAAANPFNALTSLGRSWVSEGHAHVEASLRISGMTEDALHDWLERWRVTHATAWNWFRRVELSAGREVALTQSHFDPHFHNLQRIARCHVKSSAEDDGIEAFLEQARAASEGEGEGREEAFDAWAFFERYAAANPDVAMPVELRIVSKASAADVIPWLQRIDAVEATESRSGELEIRHVVPGGTLLLSLDDVRRVTLLPERFALSVTSVGPSGARDVLIGTEDFYFAPDEARVEVEGVTFAVPDMPPRISWFETKARLRSLERQMAWAGPLACGGTIAWVSGALAGAACAHLVCDAEKARFDAVLLAARRSQKATLPGTEPQPSPDHQKRFEVQGLDVYDAGGPPGEDATYNLGWFDTVEEAMAVAGRRAREPHNADASLCDLVRVVDHVEDRVLFSERRPSSHSEK